MGNYLLAYHGGTMAQTEAEQAKAMEAWSAWFQQLGDAVVDGGNPVGQARTISSTGATIQGGGANPVSGYSMLRADSIDRAGDLAKGCPILEAGGSIEVCEVLDMM